MKKIKRFKSFFLSVGYCLAFLFGVSVNLWGQVNISAGSTVTQTFFGSNSQVPTVPTGWRFDKIVAERTLGTYSAAISAFSNPPKIQTVGGNMGTAITVGDLYNFGAGSDNTGAERAVGGITGTTYKSLNMYVLLTNNGGSSINNFTISYNVEKYRTGTNPSAFYIQMYYSTDGSTWTSAGPDFLTSFAGGEATTAGYATAPGVTVNVSNKNLAQSLANTSSLYLAWHYSFATGTDGSKAQALGIDDVTITAVAAGALTPPTLSVDATNDNVDNNIDITFTDDATWRAGITAVKIGGTALTPTTDYVITAGNLQLKPSGGNSLLTTSGAKIVTVVASGAGYTDATVTQTINPGAATKLIMKTQPTAPATNGAVLAVQPAVYIKDQYNNTTTSTATVTAAVGAGSWTLGGTTSVAGVAGTTTFSGLTASSPAAVTGATITFTSTGLTPITSNTFNIPLTLTAAGSATVDAPFDVTFTDDATWRGAITSITIGGTTLSTGYSVTAGKITFTPSASTLLQTSGSLAIVVIATGSANATVSQTLGAGVPIAANSTASSGNPLTPGLSRTLKCYARDQYNNLVPGYTFKYDVVITNNDPTTAESYTINTFARTSSISDLSTGVTGGGLLGQVNFDAALPATIDVNDGISIQVQLSDGTSNVGVPFTFTKLGQTITFAALSAATYGDSPITLTGSSSSALAVSYASSNTAVATVTGSTVTIVGAGSTDITASQAGNTTYAAATSVVRALVVNAASSSIAGGNITASGLSDAQLANTDITVSSGEMVVNLGKTVRSITVSAGAKLSVLSGQTLTLTNLTLKSDVGGTSTFVNDGTLTVTGTAAVEQYLATTRNWYVSSPVSNAVAPAGYTYYSRDESLSAAGWTPVSVGAGLTAGVGYIALPNIAGFPITFTTQNGGTLNSGNIDIPLTYTALATSAKGFNLIGNPYPCHLTWTKAFVDDASAAPQGITAPATLIEPSIYYRTNAGSVNSGVGAAWSFITYNASTDESTPALAPKGIIPPMQAFWVRAKVSGTLRMNSLLTKSHQASNPLKAPALKNSERQRVRLQVTNGTRTDETVLLFDSNAADGYDVFDSPKFAEANSEVQIYTSIDNEKLVMNGMKTMPLNQEIALGFIPGSATSFSLRANEISNLPSDVRVILKDNVKNTETDLTDGVSAYQFSPEASSENRFSLLFRAPGNTTGIDKTENGCAQVFVNAANQIAIIGAKNSNYTIYSAVGQLIENGILKTERESINAKLNTGVYVVKVNNQSTRVIVK